MRRIIAWFFVLCLFACTEHRTPAEQEKERRKLLTSVPKADVAAFLKEYGANNPETEVLISTSLGEITVKLYEDTPLHRANFIRLVKGGYYTNTAFYRILRDFMIQGGNAADYKNPTEHYTIPAEIKPHHFHKRGALAMARYDDDVNPARASSAHNYYLVQGAKVSLQELKAIAAEKRITLTPAQLKTYPEIGGAPTLDERYTVFGEITEGFEVLDKIANIPVTADDRPIKPILITMEVIR